MESPKIKVIIIKESLAESVVSDCITFGFLFGGFYLNYNYMGASTLLNAILIMMTFIGVFSRTCGKTRFTLDEAIKEIQKLKEEPK